MVRWRPGFGQNRSCSTAPSLEILRELRVGYANKLRELSAYSASVDTGFANRSASYKLAAFSGEREFVSANCRAPAIAGAPAATPSIAQRPGGQEARSCELVSSRGPASPWSRSGSYRLALPPRAGAARRPPGLPPRSHTEFPLFAH